MGSDSSSLLSGCLVLTRYETRLHWVYASNSTMHAEQYYLEPALQFLDVLQIVYVNKSHVNGQVTGGQSRIKVWESTMESFPQMAIQI